MLQLRAHYHDALSLFKIGTVSKLFDRTSYTGIEKHLSKSQFFKKGTDARNAIYVLRSLGERMIEKKKELCICYIDFAKAFDNVKHKKLIKIIQDISIPTKEI